MMKQFAQSLGIQIDWNFFASNHGKGICDGKHGVDKRVLRQRALSGNDTRSLDDYISAISSVKNTFLVFKVEGAESNDGYDCTPFTAIKKYHQFIFCPEEEDIQFREMTGKGEPTRQTIHAVPDQPGISDPEEQEGLSRLTVEVREMVEELMLEFTEPQLFNPDGTINMDWLQLDLVLEDMLLVDPLLQDDPSASLDDLQMNSE